MIGKDLRYYIRQELKHKNTKAITADLIQQGYPELMIDRTINTVKRIRVVEIFAVILLFFVVVSVALIYSFSGEPTVEPTVTKSPVIISKKIFKRPAYESCSDGILNQDEKGIDCGGVCAACSEEVKVVEKLIVATDYDEFKKARYLAKNDVAAAREVCSSFDSNAFSDSCYAVVASETQDENDCSRINREVLKDSCYYNVAVEAVKLEVCNIR